MKAFTLAVSLAVFASPALSATPDLPSGYTLAFSDVPTSAADLADGTQPGPTSANWFYNIPNTGLFGTSGNFTDLYLYDQTSNDIAPYYPFSFTPSQMNINFVEHPRSDGNLQYWTSGQLATTDTTGTLGHTFGYGYYQMKLKFATGSQSFSGAYLISAPDNPNNFQFKVGYVAYYQYVSISLYDFAHPQSFPSCSFSLTINEAKSFQTIGLEWVQGIGGNPDTVTFTLNHKDIGCHFPVTDLSVTGPVYALIGNGENAYYGGQTTTHSAAFGISEFLYATPTAQ